MGFSGQPPRPPRLDGAGGSARQRGATPGLGEARLVL